MTVGKRIDVRTPYTIEFADRTVELDVGVYDVDLEVAYHFLTQLNALILEDVEIVDEEETEVAKELPKKKKGH